MPDPSVVAHRCSHFSIGQQHLRIFAQFLWVIAEKATDTVLDQRCRMPISEHGQAGNHSFYRSHVIASLELRVGCVNIESVRLKNFFEMVPVVRCIDSAHIWVVANEADRDAIKGLFVEVP